MKERFGIWVQRVKCTHAPKTASAIVKIENNEHLSRNTSISTSLFWN